MSFYAFPLSNEAVYTQKKFKANYKVGGREKLRFISFLLGVLCDWMDVVLWLMRCTWLRSWISSRLDSTLKGH